MLVILLGQIPEAIFFALFMIFAKNIKEKRVLFTSLMCIEYALIMALFQYDWLFHVLYTIMTFLTLKLLYKEKAQVTDIFVLMISYIIMIITSVLCMALFSNTIVAATVNRIIIFLLLIICNKKLNKIQNIYKRYWNKNNEIKKIKTTTFRSLNLVIFNLLFYIINLGMTIALLTVNGGE